MPDWYICATAGTARGHPSGCLIPLPQNPLANLEMVAAATFAA